MTTIHTDWITDGPIPFRIDGADIQVVEFSMDPGDHLLAQPGTFVCAAGGVKTLGINWGKRLMDPFLRKWSGESSVLQEMICEEEPARVVLGAPQIGRIIRLRVEPGRSIICQRGAFLAATGDISVGIAFTKKLRAGLFGGQGYVFQKLSGTGDVFLHAMGSVIEWDLGVERVMRAHTAHILAFEETVDYNVQLSGGLLTLLFGGQGWFLSTLTGPGRAVVQSLNAGAVADALGIARSTAKGAKAKDVTQQS